jgi:hypothetical protein
VPEVTIRRPFNEFDLRHKAADPMQGTWTLNLARSRYFPGPAPKSQLRVLEMSDEGTLETVTTVNANGDTVKLIFQEFTTAGITQLRFEPV